MTIQRALLFGFGAVFSLWLVSAYEFVRRLGEVEGRAAEISTRFARNDELLVAVRAQVLLGSLYLPDVAIEIDPDTIPFHREQLQQTRRDIEEALEQYLPEVDSDVEREHWTRLQAEFDDYWTRMVPLLGGRVSGDSAQARALLHQQALSKHEVIVRISDALRRLNRAAFEQQQAEVTRLHDTLRQGVWWMSGVMGTLGLLIAVGATRYASGLESRIRRQHLQELQHKLDLQELSAKLVGAQEQERRSLARDLHDEVGQALTAVKIELAAVDRDLKLLGGEPHPRLHEARSIIDGTLQTVRDLSQLLHPGMLDDFGLLETVRWYVRGFSRRTGLPAKVVADEPFERMASDLEVCAYRIVQEALTNVAKHAEATSCRVHLQRRLQALVVAVEDDGRGMDPSFALRTGRSFGLMGIRERVAGFGGTFRVEGAGDTGTRLVAEFPLPSQGREAAAPPDRGRTVPADVTPGGRFDGKAPHPAG